MVERGKVDLKNIPVQKNNTTRFSLPVKKKKEYGIAVPGESR